MEPEPEPESAATKLTPKLANDILQQVEFYFGDANLPTDKFLLKTVRKDPDGWVDLSIIIGFARMKKLCKQLGSSDARTLRCSDEETLATIATVLEASELLELSEDRTRLRRTAPLPVADDSAVRTVVVENFDRNATIDSLKELFAPCGEVMLVKILQPGEQNKKMYKHPAIGGRVAVALVQYETEKQAVDAVDKLDEGKTNWRGGMRVSLLEKGKKWKQHEAKIRTAKMAEFAVGQEKKKRWTPERLRKDKEPGAEGAAGGPPRRKRMVLGKRGETAAQLAARTPQQEPQADEPEPAPQLTQEAIDYSNAVAKGPDGTRGFAWSQSVPARYVVYAERKRKQEETAAAYEKEAAAKAELAAAKLAAKKLAKEEAAAVAVAEAETGRELSEESAEASALGLPTSFS
jgi:La-related protein 7